MPVHSLSFVRETTADKIAEAGCHSQFRKTPDAERSSAGLDGIIDVSPVSEAAVRLIAGAGLEQFTPEEVAAGAAAGAAAKSRNGLAGPCTGAARPPGFGAGQEERPGF